MGQRGWVKARLVPAASQLFFCRSVSVKANKTYCIWGSQRVLAVLRLLNHGAAPEPAVKCRSSHPGQDQIPLENLGTAASDKPSYGTSKHKQKHFTASST